MPGIPDRWEAYSPLGGKVGNTNFIPFKVPLKLTLCKHLPEMKKFTPFHLLNMVKRLGLVIDLTNTRRYYNPEDLTSSGVHYVKIFCQGRGNVPNNEIVRKFYDAVQDFLNEKKDGLIGVHCTHGLNRTGYLICRYMIENLGYSAENAIKEFNEARGHDIERPEYLNDLYKVEEKHIDAGKPEKIEGRGIAYNSYPMKYRNARDFDPAINSSYNTRIYGRSYRQSNSVFHHASPVRYQHNTTEIHPGRKNNGWNNYNSRYQRQLHNEAAYLPLKCTYPFQVYGNGDHEKRSESFASFSQWHHPSRQSGLNE